MSQLQTSRAQLAPVVVTGRGREPSPLLGVGTLARAPAHPPVVWPITALYSGPVAIWGYRRFGWSKSPRWRDEHGYGDEPPKRRG